MRLEMFLSMNRKAWISRLIARVSGPWTHMGIGFDLEDGAQIYYESLFTEGFHGPKPWSKIPAWAEQDPRRKWARRSLDLSPEISERKRAVAQAHVGRLGYAAWQLLAMWWFERVGRRYGWHVPRSPNKAVCSEAVAAILWPEVKLTTPERPGLDEVSPSSAWEKIARIAEAAGGLGLNSYPTNAVNNALRGPRIVRNAQGVPTPAPGGDRRFATAFRRFAQAMKKEVKPHAA